MLSVLAIPYRTFKEQIRLVREYEDAGYSVSVEDGYILCIGKTKPMEVMQ